MSSMTKQYDDKQIDRLVAVAAVLAEGSLDGSGDSLKVAARIGGISPDDFVQLLSDEHFLNLVEAEQIKRRMTGEEARSKARNALSKVITSVSERANGDDMPVSTMIKAGEFLHRVSGIGDEHAAELRKQSGEVGAGVFVVYAGEPEPDTSGLKHALIIRLKHPRKNRDAKVIDVTDSEVTHDD